ncbi:MAG: hypothetical protein K2J88_03520 [Oscillospiraceae bacterium]|nr:hypothetical protein [Oscillospiraceae bacterium]
MFEQDYIMIQIKQIIEVAMKMFFNIDIATPATMMIQDQDKRDKSDKLILEIDGNNIRNAIADFKSVTSDKTKDDLLIGFYFFTKLCALDEEILNANNITYSEIQDEMRMFLAQYGIGEQIFNLIFMQ